MERSDVKQLTTLFVALAGVASAVGSCNQAAQERVKADNKIYSTLADAQGVQAKDIMNLHNEISELRGYLESVRRSQEPESDDSGLSSASLTGLHASSGKPRAPSLEPPPAPLLRPLPPAAPAPTLKRLPKFSEL